MAFKTIVPLRRRPSRQEREEAFQEFLVLNSRAPEHHQRLPVDWLVVLGALIVGGVLAGFVSGQE